MLCVSYNGDNDNIKVFKIKMIKIINAIRRIFTIVKKCIMYIIGIITQQNNKQKGQKFDDKQDDETTDEEIWSIMFPKDIKGHREEVRNFSDLIEDKAQEEVFIKMHSHFIDVVYTEKYNKVGNMSMITIEENKTLTIVRKDNMIGAITVIKFLGKVYMVTCNHVLQMLDTKEVMKYSSLNEHVQVNTTIINNVSFRWVIPYNSKVTWYTYDYKNGTHVYVETTVTKPIPTLVKINGRDRVTTVGIIVSMSNEHKLVMSGTVMIVEEKPFIVTYVCINTKTNVCIIVAVAMMYMENIIRLVKI